MGALKDDVEKEVTVKLDESDRGQANPSQTWTGHEGNRSLRFPDFKKIVT